ncbi:sugar phosphate nucleotidyltransferase [Paenibacillus piri]|uniref:Mannose-1-phosphate guanylyltransferase n=1 Tax=Paenibacillus piri TaxID=2547395 RepID=A0A4R5KL81_9BACL|nr:sugar phosphate nucleotidyltransferase [Paenibacillus piri]TDF96329.1 mannose-1-phosphate guanylyltransferase [Paenibacillus piri]
MNMVLLSGGSGSRLWPLSSERRSKQFIPFFKDGNGRPSSMLQNVWSQLQSRGLHRSTVIATSSSQRDQIAGQLGETVDLVLEPEKRDTFPAIMLSVAYLYSRKGIPPDEIVAVMPVDSCVEDSFYDVLQQLPDALRASGANVALVGVRPSYPSVKYGYIIPERPARLAGALAIREFHEKPSAEAAQRYIARGALWNCGVFAFRAGFLLDKLAAMGLPAVYEELLLEYNRLESRSFDYAVVEKEKKVAALVYDKSWKDLGSWCTLVEELSQPVTGAGLISEGSRDVHIVNELKLPIVVHGLSDVVVAAGREGILVMGKGAGGGLKDTLSRLSGSGGVEADPEGLAETAASAEAAEPATPEDGAGSVQAKCSAGSAGLVTSPPAACAMPGATAASRLVIDRSTFADGIVVTTTRIHLNAGERLVYEPQPTEDRRTVSWTVLHGRLQLMNCKGEMTLSSGGNAALNEGDAAVIQAEEEADLLEVVTAVGGSYRRTRSEFM